MTSAAVEEYLSLTETMIAQPFPEADVQDAGGYGGPGYRVRILRASQDFWDDPDGQAWERAERELRADLEALGATFTERWGEPREVDLWPCLRAGCEGEAVPEPYASLSGHVVGVRVWPLPERGRWLGLAVGQEDKELPLELVAVVAAGSPLDRPGPVG
ncbi:hypothetical protein [Actinacidiphila sp. bgisy160]|uniref:hypothetical protein n=1 Tax=Actinacidiphila sp. bgisy160 TaxID=3413796 RepID=UPI003D765C71